MTRNRSLEEFAADAGADDPAGDAGADRSAGAASSSADGAADAEAADAEASGTADEAAPEPLASTYAWSPEGHECAACGAAVEERWRDGDDLVCLDCKEW